MFNWEVYSVRPSPCMGNGVYMVCVVIKMEDDGIISVGPPFFDVHHMCIYC